MSLVQSNWQPSASLTALKQRAKIIKQIRVFFEQRKVLEVETPILGAYTVTDPFMKALTAGNGYLQTSPEYFMKRLLAYGSGDIYQLGKCFRDDELGRIHKPEFTLLEWYRLSFDHHQLMDEMDDLLQLVLQRPAATRVSYQEIFQQLLNLDPLTADIPLLKATASQIDCPDMGDDKDAWLQILFSERIEPHLNGIVFVYNYPASQAALAKLNPNDPRVADRFEVYIDTLEIANGFHELTNVKQQLARFENDNVIRARHGLPVFKIDLDFIAALEHGLPNCAGVALGVDRLIMLALKRKSIAEVCAFSE